MHRSRSDRATREENKPHTRSARKPSIVSPAPGPEPSFVEAGAARTIAHDLNNVLQAMESACELIERNPTPEKLPRYLKMARTAIERGQALSKTLSSLAHASQKKQAAGD